MSATILTVDDPIANERQAIRVKMVTVRQVDEKGKPIAPGFMVTVEYAPVEAFNVQDEPLDPSKDDSWEFVMNENEKSRFSGEYGFLALDVDGAEQLSQALLRAHMEAKA